MSVANSKHNPNGGASDHCPSAQIETLIAQYKTSRDLSSLSSIVELSQDRALTLIRFYRTTRYKPKDELLSDINCKLIKAVDSFNPEKGTAFTFVSQVIANVLFTSVSNARKEAHRYKKLTRRILVQLTDKKEDGTAVADIAHRLKANAKTSLTDSIELSAQRWYVDSFLVDGFESCRHECANAAMIVFPLTHARSRELYDLTMLEVRRVLYNDVPRRQQIAPGRLFGTRLAWMTRYAPLMDSSEFTKFVALMRDLAPYLLLLVDVQNHNRRRDRCPAVSRKNIELVLYGDPDAVPLFSKSISDDKEAIPVNSLPL